MTPEERFDAHEQWLLDHDRAIARHDAVLAEWLLTHTKAIAEIREIQREQAEVQRKQSAVMLELTQMVVRLLDRENGHRNDGR